MGCGYLFCSSKFSLLGAGYTGFVKGRMTGWHRLVYSSSDSVRIYFEKVPLTLWASNHDVAVYIRKDELYELQIMVRHFGGTMWGSFKWRGPNTYTV